MPACMYVSDHELKAWSTVEEDEECNDLLQQLRKSTGENWLIQVRQPQTSTKWWSRKEPPLVKTYTLYFHLWALEVQVINLCTEYDTGSVFSSSSRSDVMNYMMGYINGLLFKNEI